MGPCLVGWEDDIVMRWNKYYTLAVAGIAYLIVYAALFCDWSASDCLYRAQWIYANSDLLIMTNEVGAVMQPKIKRPEMGVYQNPKHHPTDELKIVLSPRKKDALVKKVAEMSGCRHISTNEVLKVLKSVNYTISDDPIPIVMVEVEAKSSALSLGVLNAISGEICQRAESEETRIRQVLRIGSNNSIKVFRVQTLSGPKLIYDNNH